MFSLTFWTQQIEKGTDWRALERAVARLMTHCGWRDVAVIGETGDKGGDVVGVRIENGKRKTWVVQVKAKSGGDYCGVDGLNQVMQAQGVYSANVSVLGSNADFSASVGKRRDELLAAGFDVRLWNGKFCEDLISRMPALSVSRKTAREYQSRIITKSLNEFDEGRNKVQFVVATGLGKTLIAAEIVRGLYQRGLTKFLVLCHSRDLALQLEQSFWAQLEKSIPTRYFFDGVPPLADDGVSFGLYQTLQGWLSGIDPDAFDAVIVDEAHYAMAHGFYACLTHLKPKFLVGMTATPWRGDGVSIDQLFGEPIDRVSLVDGMNEGYLAQVDYKLFCDNIDWDAVETMTAENLTIRDLNKTLFLPQRDEIALSEILSAAREIDNPRIAIFSPSVEHGRRFADMVSAAGITCRALSGVDKVERRRRLLDFGAGKIQAVTAVNVLNEGIDIPDVNLMVFMRATHSRRIFVQQLGRGLRLTDGKERVTVLDFVSDVRRLAAMAEMRDDLAATKRKRTVFLNSQVTFNDIKAEKFIDAWLQDVASLSETEDSEKLKFPGVWE